MKYSDSLLLVLVFDERFSSFKVHRQVAISCVKACILLITVESDNKKDRRSAKAAKEKGDQSKSIKVVSSLNGSLAGRLVEYYFYVSSQQSDI